MRSWSALGILTVIAVVAVGCGETVIDDVKIEDQSQSNLEKVLPQRLAQGAAGEELQKELEIAPDEKISSVDCPSDVEVEVGATFTCTVTFANGKKAEETFKILDEDANVGQVSFGPSRSE
ncbi:MAG TPA: DUF4333 domain-containing protein [Solirubrobacterales bacterium]